jgi:glycosyltransferase involved in cell wall biosynthesis
MKAAIKRFLFRLPGFTGIPRKLKELDSRQAEIELLQRKFTALMGDTAAVRERGPDSVDRTPWAHPYLSAGNIRRFRTYSEEVWRFAEAWRRDHPAPLNCAFAVNMAQSMYKWARLARQYGARPVLFPNTMDRSALSCPEWEDYDGEYGNIMDGDGFLAAHPGLKPDVPCRRIPFDGAGLYVAYRQFYEGSRAPLLRLLAAAPGLRHEALVTYKGFYPSFELAKALSAFDVIYVASTPFPAYASGRPYCVFSVGGDLQEDCGRGDDLGRAMHLSFNAARFLMVSNPHSLGHSRRLGLTNGVYLPYPMDDTRYAPGEGLARREWEAQLGPGVFVLTTARLDDRVKGHSDALFAALVEAARACESLRFVFLGWGESRAGWQRAVEEAGLQRRVLVLPPAGKKRLIDYYRSCDLVLDQFVYGYFGATALEAASVGKPVVMRLRAEQYAPLYDGDLPPVTRVESPADVREAIVKLADNRGLREQTGKALRDWLVRQHGEERTAPIMLALLRVAADRAPLPPELRNPLLDELSNDEQQYHRTCVQAGG